MKLILNVDDDLWEALARLTAEKGLPLEVVVNDALREGVRALEANGGRAFRTATVSLGRCLVGDLSSVSEALALGEDESPS